MCLNHTMYFWEELTFTCSIIWQSKAKAEKNQAIGHSENENSCQLCRVEKLTFEPPPIYCSPCGARIKRNAPYYTVGTGDTRHYFCIPCYNESRGETIEVDGQTFPKAKLEKKRNDEETEEWVSLQFHWYGGVIKAQKFLIFFFCAKHFQIMHSAVGSMWQMWMLATSNLCSI